MNNCQLCSLDFTLYHFLPLLMRGMGEFGHKLVGVCSDSAFAGTGPGGGFSV